MAKRRYSKRHSTLKNYFIPHKGNNYRPLLFTVGSLAVVLALIVLFEAAYLVDTKLVEQKTDFFASVLPSVLVDLTNQDRAANGVGALTVDPLLTQAAQLKADDMASKGYFAHVSPEGKTPWYWLGQVGYKYTYAGENLAVNFSDSKDVEDAWMASPTHHANIVKSQYTRVGFATAQGMYEGKETTFVVQEFATPADAPAPAPVKAATAKPASITTAIEDVVTAKPVAKTQETQKAETQPASVATETPAADSGGTLVALAPTTTQVLGTETGGPGKTVNVAAATDFFAQVATAPTHTSTYVLGTLAGVMLLLLLVAIFVHMRVQYVEVIGGGLVVVAAAFALLVFNATSAPSVQVPSDTQSASVVQAL